MKQWKTGSGSLIYKVSGGRSNIFIISKNQCNILIDTGPAFMGRNLLKNLDRIEISTIDFLILTHTHFDHAANTFLIRKKYGTKIIVHEAEANFLLSGDSPVPNGTNIFTSFLVKNLGHFTEKIVRYRACPADIKINQQLDLSYSGINILIIPTPGHSAGSLSIIVDNEIALVGDTLMGTYPGSCFPPFADNVAELLNSWQLLLNTGCQLFLPSHGGSRTRAQLEVNLGKKLKVRKSYSGQLTG